MKGIQGKTAIIPGRPTPNGEAVAADLNRPGCLRDFVWTRAHPRARRKIPNRFSSGSMVTSSGRSV